MNTTPQITIVATMSDLLGAVSPNSTLTMQLCGFGSQVPRVRGTALLVKVAPVPFVTGGTGIITEQVWGNDVISPAGTYYTFAVTDDRGNRVQLNAYQFTGAGSFDLSTAALYDPPPPPVAGVNPVLLNPPEGALQTIQGPITINGNLIVTGTINGGSTIYTVAYSANPIFDGLLGSSFKITLTGNVAVPSFINMAGKILVPFRIKQDATGGRLFPWPATMRGGQEVNPGAGITSTQLFAVDTDGSMDAVGPMMYS